MTTAEKIAVMQAYEEGKQIQIYCEGSGWTDWNVSWEPIWDWDKHEYRIKPEEKPVRMTNRQLAEWLIKGNGECLSLGKSSCISTLWWYYDGEEDCLVGDRTRIRHWGSDDWVEPTVDIYNRDCKGVKI